MKTMTDTLAHLGLHLRDNIGALNKAFHAGDIDKDEWRQLLDSIGDTWKLYKEVTGHSVDDATRHLIDKAPAGGRE